MNVVQHHLGQLYNAIQANDKVDGRQRAIALTKLEDLEAWLTWTEIKAQSGVIPEENLKQADPQRLSDEEWFETLDHFPRAPVWLDGDGNYLVEIVQGDLRTLYRSPDISKESKESQMVFHAMMKDRGVR